MDAKLTVVGGKASKSRVSVKLPAVIGRSRQADLTVAHPMVSRKHCELYEVDGLLKIRDLGSLNGLYVDGKQVSEAALHPNSEFVVGPLTFRVEYEFPGMLPPSLEANTADEETPAVEFLPKAEVIPEAEVTPEAGDFDLEVTESEPQGPEEAEVDLEVGDFDLDVDQADPGPAEAAPEATEFDPEIDGFRPDEGHPDPDPRKTLAIEETLVVQEQPADAEPDPKPAEPPPPKITPQGSDADAGAGQPDVDEETIDDEPPYFTPPAEPPPRDPDQAKPQDGDLDDFLKGFQ